MFNDARWRKSPEEMARRHPTREAILAILPGFEVEGLTAEEVRSGLDGDHSAQAISYHLAILRNANLVQVSGGPAARFTLAA